MVYSEGLQSSYNFFVTLYSFFNRKGSPLGLLFSSRNSIFSAVIFLTVRVSRASGVFLCGAQLSLRLLFLTVKVSRASGVFLCGYYF
ncbi:MAG: hypothetical protein EBR30_09785 [Cytophagia bacterium]|nr:hypothetical protein [Cytophagia bacterium]